MVYIMTKRLKEFKESFQPSGEKEEVKN